MDEIFITLKIPGQNGMDLKIPGYMTGEGLLAIAAEITGRDIPVGAKLQAEPIGRILENARALDSEGVETGALLTVL